MCDRDDLHQLRTLEVGFRFATLICRFAIKNYALVSEAFSAKKQDVESPEEHNFASKEFEMTNVGKQPEDKSQTQKKEPEEDFIVRSNTIQVDLDLETDQDHDLVLAELSEGDGDSSNLSDTSGSSGEIEGGDQLQTESEVVLRTSKEFAEDKQKEQKQKAAKHKNKKKTKKIFMLKKKGPAKDQDVFDYRKIKDQEFTNFFLNGLDAKPLSSRSVIFINFFLVMRLMCYDICYITLGFLPQVQILAMLSMETVLLMMILRA